jgi:glyoxylate/succinic semialdehyde reductase
MIKGEYPTAFPLKHQHKDLRLALELADTVTLAELPLAKLTEAVYRQGAFGFPLP